MQNALGEKIENPAKLKRIREKLLEALEEVPCKAVKPAKKPAAALPGKAGGKPAAKRPSRTTAKSPRPAAE